MQFYPAPYADIANSAGYIAFNSNLSALILMPEYLAETTIVYALALIAAYRRRKESRNS